MTPGIARGPPFPTKAIKNAVVAIASLERPSVPMVVGVCEIDVSALDVVQGAKGHAVRGVHWNGDEIWSWNNGGKSGKDMPESIEGWDDEDGGLGGRFGSIKIDESDESDEQGGVTVAGMGEPEAAEVPDDRNNHVEGEDPPFMEADEASKKSLSTQGIFSRSFPTSYQNSLTMLLDIDAAFWSAFLFAAHQARIDHKLDPRHGLNFPIPQSNIISNLVLPYLPIFTPEDASSLQIKKTSWKNARKFIKALDKEKLLRSKDRDGHEVVVLDIDFEDPAITAFVPYRLPKKDTPGADIGGGGGGKAIASSTSTSSSSDSSIGQKLKKLNLYKPKEKLAPIFDRADGGTRNLYLASEFRSLITTYVEAESLISPTNKRLVILNPVLANAVFDGQSSLDREVLAKGSVPRDALIDRVIHSSIPHWVLLRDGETRETVKAKSGTGPLVNITLETRSGNKTVTKVSGVETFHINPHVIAEELQKTCASSTSVGQLVGSSPKNPVQEIMVQGPQKDSVTKALEKRGVERGWIQVLDKTKGKKR